MMNGTNQLIQRILAIESFTTRYDEIFDEVYTLIYQEKRMEAEIADISKVFLERNAEHSLLDSSKYASSITSLLSTISRLSSITAESSRTSMM
ncbi:hypothetical protein FACS1894176_08650 [Bacteroidia bacterium]|nr:hypothetical protein FACS1894176_08650 [Bacteroidia bacterium]